MTKNNLLVFLLLLTGFVYAQNKEVVFQSKTHYLLSEKLFFLHHLIEKENKFIASGLAVLRPDAITQGNLVYEDSVANLFLRSAKFEEKSAKELMAFLQKNSLVEKTTTALQNSNRYSNPIDEKKLQEIWISEIELSNQIINTYLLDKKGRYPTIDSTSFKKNDSYYHTVIKEILAIQKNSPATFEEIHFAIELLEANNRDEAVRYEPIDQWNVDTVNEVKNIDFSKYEYSTLLILGEGPENGWSFSPNTRLRCKLAARLFLDKKAPFIIVSGGHTHPFQTPFCEAIEMKKYLVKELMIPEKFIIIEPYARHTTTNLRNANRLVLHYQLPIQKPILVVSNEPHIDYVCLPKYIERNKEETGIVPLSSITRIDAFSASYFLTKESLHISLTDPLDP